MQDLVQAAANEPHPPPQGPPADPPPAGENPFAADQVQTCFARCATPLIIVKAPPGAGKTEALALRFIEAVRSDVEPDRALMISYTNRARASFESRVALRDPALEHRIAAPQERAFLPLHNAPLWIGTFHDVCARILRLHPDLSCLPRSFTVETGNSRLIRMRAALHATRRLPSGEREANSRAYSLLRLWDAAAAAGVFPDDSADAGPPLSPGWNPHARTGNDIAVFRAFRHMQHADSVADVQLVPVAIRLLYRDHPHIDEAWSRRWDEVLVDEYQDTSPVLTALLSVWARHAALAVAGDTDQNIFSFANAIGTFDRIRELTFKPTPTILNLQHDYRLTRQTQNAVNLLRSRLISPGATPLPATRQGPEPAAHRTKAAALPNLLRQHILDDIRAHARAARTESTFSDATVLCRTHQDCSEIAAALAANGIPVWLHQSPDAAIIAHNAISWLKLILNPDNHVTFPSAMSFCSPAPSRSLIDDAETLSRASQTAPERALACLASRLHEGHQARIGAEHALSILHACRAMFDSPAADLPAALTHLFERIGIEQHLAAATLPVQMASRRTLERLHYIAHTVDNLRQLLDLYNDLEHLGETPPANTVEIRTMHGAKGHQAPCIYALHWEEGTFPKYDDNLQRLDEDRKLALVAISRASHSFRAYVRDDAPGPGTTGTRPSRFLGEASIPVRDDIRAPAPKLNSAASPSH